MVRGVRESLMAEWGGRGPRRLQRRIGGGRTADAAMPQAGRSAVMAEGRPVRRVGPRQGVWRRQRGWWDCGEGGGGTEGKMEFPIIRPSLVLSMPLEPENVCREFRSQPLAALSAQCPRTHRRCSAPNANNHQQEDSAKTDLNRARHPSKKTPHPQALVAHTPQSARTEPPHPI